MSPAIARPVPRRKVLVGALLGALLIAGLIAGTEALRYPHPTSAAVTAPGGRAEPASDPRDPIECEDPIPREGQVRREDGGDDDLRRVTSSQLYDCPQTFDGSLVRYRGEVIGAVLQRNEGAWIHLNDDIYAGAAGPLPAHRDYRGGNGGAGVFVPHDIAAQITYVGGPRTRGDIVDVVGVFHRVDETTGEVAILRAVQATVTPGGPLQRPSLPLRRTVAIVMVVAMAVTVGAERLLRARK